VSHESIIKCETCGCEGNTSCGHEPIDARVLCALYPDGVCGCCKGVPKIKIGTIDPDLKAKIDGLQFLIDKYQDCLIACLSEDIEPNATYFFRRRIAELIAEKWGMVKRI